MLPTTWFGSSLVIVSFVIVIAENDSTGNARQEVGLLEVLVSNVTGS